MQPGEEQVSELRAGAVVAGSMDGHADSDLADVGVHVVVRHREAAPERRQADVPSHTNIPAEAEKDSRADLGVFNAVAGRSDTDPAGQKEAGQNAQRVPSAAVRSGTRAESGWR